MTTPNSDPVNFEELEKEFNERTQAWESNHIAITKAMAHLIRQNERWPTKAELAEETGLSRPTIYIHLKEFDRQDVMGAELEELKFMSSEILARLIESAIGGDMKAMRLSFEVMGILKKGKSSAGTEAQKRDTGVIV